MFPSWPMCFYCEDLTEMHKRHHVLQRNFMPELKIINFFLKIAQRKGKHHPCHKSCNKNTRKLLFSHSSAERLFLRRFYSLNVRSETLNYVYWTHIREINATWKEKDLNFSVTIYLYLHFTMNWNFYSANHAKD